MKCIGKFAEKKVLKEKNNGELRVEPNCAFSIREILERFSRGLPLEDFIVHSDEGEYEIDIDKVNNPRYDVDIMDVEDELRSIQPKRMSKQANEVKQANEDVKDDTKVNEDVKVSD